MDWYSENTFVSGILFVLFSPDVCLGPRLTHMSPIATHVLLHSIFRRPVPDVRPHDGQGGVWCASLEPKKKAKQVETNTSSSWFGPHPVAPWLLSVWGFGKDAFFTHAPSTPCARVQHLRHVCPSGCLPGPRAQRAQSRREGLGGRTTVLSVGWVTEDGVTGHRFTLL